MEIQKQKEFWSLPLIFFAGIIFGFIGSAVLTLQNLRKLESKKKNIIFFWILVAIFVLVILSTILFSLNLLQYFIINSVLVLLLITIQSGLLEKYREENNSTILYSKPNEAILIILISTCVLFLLIGTMPILEEGFYKVFPKITGQPLYNPYDASEMIYKNMTQELKQKLTEDDIFVIIESEFQYQQNNQVVDDKVEVVSFIQGESVKSNKNYTIEEINKVIELESLYLKKIGIK